MGLFGWWKRRRGAHEDRRLGEWRRAWHDAAQAGDLEAATRLTAGLEALGLPEEEIEIEREMLEGLERVSELSRTVAAGGLPVLTTGHRVVGSDRCHFSAPASMPDEPGQPGGRLLLTNTRAIFVGGTSSSAIPWHAVAEVRPLDRDIVLIRRDRERLYRFRCNSYGDAMTAALLARGLVDQRRPDTSAGRT